MADGNGKTFMPAHVAQTAPLRNPHINCRQKRDFSQTFWIWIASKSTDNTEEAFVMLGENTYF